VHQLRPFILDQRWSAISISLNVRMLATSSFSRPSRLFTSAQCSLPGAPLPGKTDAMEPAPDHGEKSYRGSDRLAGKKAIITGADSGIGRAVAIAYAREGADVLIAYLNEHDDAKQTERFVKDAGRNAVRPALAAGIFQARRFGS
jgi:hypothetical protein